MTSTSWAVSPVDRNDLVDMHRFLRKDLPYSFFSSLRTRSGDDVRISADRQVAFAADLV